MRRRTFVRGAMAAAASLALPVAAIAEGAVKIGLILPLTGQQASTGKQIKAAVELYMKQHGTRIAGRTLTSSSRMTAPYPTTPSASPRS